MVWIAEVKDKLIIDYRAREWCKLPYPKHPHGCPNYGKKRICPPQVCLIEDYLDLEKRMWVVAVKFNLEAHIGLMKEKHPNWSYRQAKCVLYWQSSVNKRLREATEKLCSELPGSRYTLCPEAMGVQVIKTTKRLGLPIVPRPSSTIYKVSLVGYGDDNSN